MTSKTFNQVADQVRRFVGPFVQKQGATYNLKSMWLIGTVIADSYQDTKSKTWVTAISGGLARLAYMTPDALTLVICHETGHHFGGYFFYKDSTYGASSEGEADYFSSQVCARDLWKSETALNASFRKTVTPLLKEKCDGSWKTEEDQNLCYRIASGTVQTMKVLAAVTSKPEAKPETPDPLQVDASLDSYPKTVQCRLDTVLQGALCSKQADWTVIPGKRFADQNSVSSEEEASHYNCFEKEGDLGSRPRCWFKELRN